MSAPPALWPQGNVQNPITQSGRVVINAAKDEYSIQARRSLMRTQSDIVPQTLQKIGWNGNDDDNDFSVLTHEIAVHDNRRDFESRLARHESVQVITSANGLTMEDFKIGNMDPMKVPRISFVGIAGTRARHNETSLAANETDCVVQIGGLCTIINNGPLPIRVGEWVCWDFPEPRYDLNGQPATAQRQRQQGVPDSKAQFRVRGYNAFMTSLIKGCDPTSIDEQDMSYECMMSDTARLNTTAEHGSALHRLAKFVEFGNSEETSNVVQALYTPMLQSTTGNILKAQNIAREVSAGRVFGKAMSTSQPGQQLDILLGAHCM